MEMNRDELLTKLAMELAEWPESPEIAGRKWEIDGFFWQLCFGGSGPEVAIARGKAYEFEGIREHHWLQRRAELINKPSWDEAPKWATHLCQNGDGEWKWYPQEPYTNEVCGGVWCHDANRFSPCRPNQLATRGAILAGHDWRQTLERRPTGSKECGVIYAIHRKTKEHRIVSRLDVLSSYDWRYAVADADGWIPWEGGECPLQDGVKFQYTLREGSVIDFDEASEIRWWHATRNDSRALSGVDIIAYRPILDGPSETEVVEWDGEGRPPVGEIVMVDSGECKSPGKVLALDHNIVVVRYESGMGFRYSGFEIDAISPIRSEEDRAVEAMLKVVHGNGHLSETGARALYRDGYRKQEAE